MFPNFGGSLLCMHTPFDAKPPNLKWKHIWLVFRWSAPPLLQGGRSQCSSICGFLSIYAHTICHRTTKFDVVTHMRKRLVFKSLATPPLQMGVVPALPNFTGSPVFMRTCVHSVLQNNQISHSNLIDFSC